jgi:hypothetical protein
MMNTDSEPFFFFIIILHHCSFFFARIKTQDSLFFFTQLCTTTTKQLKPHQSPYTCIMKVTIALLLAGSATASLFSAKESTQQYMWESFKAEHGKVLIFFSHPRKIIFPKGCV